MKTTKYFDSLSLRPDRALIKIDWIQRVVHFPEQEHIGPRGQTP
jgi:hypothetical protein